MSRCAAHTVKLGHASLSQRLSYSSWLPLRCVRTVSPTSRTAVVQLSSYIPKRYTGARDTTFARSARNNWIPKRDGYIHTYKLTVAR